MQHDHFKDNHEGLAARQFLPRYNKLHCTNFELIVKESNAEPDFHSRDTKTGEVLNFDVTLGATRQMIDEWRKLLRKDYRDPESGSALSIEKDQEACRKELKVCKDNITKKFSKRYGKNCALVLYYFNTSRYAKEFVDDLRMSINFTASPFNKGIWLLSAAAAEFHRIDEVHA